MNECAENQCAQCCKGNIMTMTFEEASYYAGSRKIVPVVSKQMLLLMAKQRGLDPEPLYIVTGEKRNSSGSLVGKKSFEELLQSNPGKTAIVLNPGDCHHLVWDINSQRQKIQVCGAYGTNMRPECCENYELGSQACIIERRDAGIPTTQFIGINEIAIMES